MDLYGDLPPEGEINSSNEIKSIHIGIRHDSVNGESNKDSKPLSFTMKSKETIKSTKVSSLQFKPRQTTVTIPHHNSTIIPSKTTPPVNSVNNTSNFSLGGFSANSVFEIITVNSITKHSIDETMDKSMDCNFDVDDPYDPRKPNDYLTVLEERQEIERLNKLERNNAALLMEQEIKRQEMEEERRQAASAGDFNKLQTLMPAGRGRGRAINNLPSWMTQGKQLNPNPESNILEPESNIGIIESKNNQPNIYDEPSTVTNSAIVTAPSNIIVINNMVDISEADNRLIQETSSECSKYGSVCDCQYKIKNQNVEVYVIFEKQESAVKAFRDLNGRFFGGRQIKVNFVNQDDYSNIFFT